MRRLTCGLVGLLLWAGWAHGQSAEERLQTVRFLHSLQKPAGGFLPALATAEVAAKEQTSLRATLAAARALKYFGGTVPDPKKAAHFVRSCFDPSSGGFADRPGGRPDVTATAVGLMAVVELKMPVEEFKAAEKYLGDNAKGFEDIRIAAAGFEATNTRPPQADDWLKEIADLRNPHGTFGKVDEVARETGGAVAAILRLGGTVEHQDAILQAIHRGQRNDGGFGKAGVTSSDLESTYRVMRGLVMLKSKPADPRALRAFIARCRNADGGYGVAPGQPSQTGATYYAGIVLHWLSQK